MTSAGNAVTLVAKDYYDDYAARFGLSTSSSPKSKKVI